MRDPAAAQVRRQTNLQVCICRMGERAAPIDRRKREWLRSAQLCDEATGRGCRSCGARRVAVNVANLDLVGLAEGHGAAQLADRERISPSDGEPVHRPLLVQAAGSSRAGVPARARRQRAGVSVARRHHARQPPGREHAPCPPARNRAAASQGPHHPRRHGRGWVDASVVGRDVPADVGSLVVRPSCDVVTTERGRRRSPPGDEDRDRPLRLLQPRLVPLSAEQERQAVDALAGLLAALLARHDGNGQASSVSGRDVPAA